MGIVVVKKQDRKRVSLEEHEVRYVKGLIKTTLAQIKQTPETKKVLIRCSKLRRLCNYANKFSPKTRGHDGA